MIKIQNQRALLKYFEEQKNWYRIQNYQRLSDSFAVLKFRSKILKDKKTPSVTTYYYRLVSFDLTKNDIALIKTIISLSIFHYHLNLAPLKRAALRPRR